MQDDQSQIPAGQGLVNLMEIGSVASIPSNMGGLKKELSTKKQLKFDTSRPAVSQEMH